MGRDIPLRRADGDDSAGLAFILGFPRAGTTLLGQIAAALPDVALLEERPVLAKAIVDLCDHPAGATRLATLAPEQADFYRRDFWQRVHGTGIATAGKLAVEQTAFNTVYLPMILTLFPQSPIVFAIRDPRDVVFGCFRRRFAPNRFTRELRTIEGAARLYCDTMELQQACRERLSFRPLDIRNEDLIADFDRETRRLCAFLGREWHETLRDFHRGSDARTLATLSSVQVRRGVSAAGIGRWRSYRSQMSAVLPMLQPWVERFGYAAM